MTQRRIIGIILVIISVLILGFLFVAYFISSFVIGAIQTQITEDNSNAIANVNIAIAENNLNTSVDETLSDLEFSNQVSTIVSSGILALSLPVLVVLIVGIYLIVKDKAKINQPQSK
jgi:hypothetical protein